MRSARLALRSTLILAPALVLVACGEQGEQAGQASEGGPDTAATAATPAATNPLLDPRSAAMNETAPAVYRARFATSKGDFVIEVHRDWAPRGADRFYNLVQGGFYDGARFFRVIEGFMAQFGLAGDPQVSAAWRSAPIADDSVAQSNRRGTISYAMAGPNTRTTQVFINFVDNTRLDELGFAPFATVVEGMDIVDQLYAGYGEGAPNGRGPSQAQIQTQGNEYLTRDFPNLDYINQATILQP